MGLPTKILIFFLPQNNQTKQHKFGEFIDLHQAESSAVNISIILNKLLLEGYLIQTSGTPDLGPREREYQTVIFQPSFADYGVYEFIIFGFPHIRQVFINSIFRIVVKKTNGDLSIGTGFLIEFNDAYLIVTAKHVIIGNDGIKILRSDDSIIEATEIWTTWESDENIDIAIIKVQNQQIDLKAFKHNTWKVLDEVLTMGYPPIPGFDSLQLSETSTIAASKSTTGQITGDGNSYIGNQDYFLISARVKGGNSGGPVIDKSGKVIGVITEFPQDDDKMDLLGYGIATPIEVVLRILESIYKMSDLSKVKKLNLSRENEGYTKCI